MTATTATLLVTHHQYYLTCPDEEIIGTFDYRGFNGLVAPLGADGALADPGMVAVVMTGTEFGPVRITLETHGTPPGAADLDPWSEVVEFSLRPPEAPLFIATVDDMGENDLPDLSALDPGPYRIRIHARGRDEAHQRITHQGEPIEEHLIQAWAAPVASLACLKLSDAYGASVRAR